MKIKSIFTIFNTITVTIMIILAMVLAINISNVNNEYKWVEHTYKVINKAELLMINMIDQETDLNAYLATGDEKFVESFYAAHSSFENGINDLKYTVSDNPAQVSKILDIENLENQWHTESADIYLSMKQESIEKNEGANIDFEISLGKSSIIMNQIRQEVDTFIGVEEELLIERREALSRRYTMSIFAIVVAAFVVIVVWILQTLTTKRITKPLEQFSNQMKEFDLDNLDNDFIIDHKVSYEVAELEKGYAKLIDELKTAQWKRVTSDIQVQKLLLETSEANHKLKYANDELENKSKELGHKISQLELAERELERLTRTDMLTGVYNRRGFSENLDLNWRRALRNKQAFTVLMIDIDNFKLFNDTYGHVEGDNCLRKVAKIISEQLGRPYDSVSRYGGEEFVVILPETDSNGGLTIAEKIRTKIAELVKIGDNYNGFEEVTVSIGIATAHPTTKVVKETVLEYADQALYKAKNEGKNRSEVYEHVYVVPDINKETLISSDL